MNTRRFRGLRLIALVFLLTGFAGFVASSGVSMNYKENLPRLPMPSDLRMTPRTIDGIVVYETPHEALSLNALDDGSAIVFFTGLCLSLAYMWNCGMRRALAGDRISEDAGN